MEYVSQWIALATITVAGIVGIVGTSHLPLFDRRLPAAGLWPRVIGIALLVICAIHMIELLLKYSKPVVNSEEVKRSVSFALFFIVITMGGGYLLGLLPALAIFMFVAFMVWNDLKAMTALVVSAGLIFVVYFTFTTLLNVRFTTGLLSW